MVHLIIVAILLHFSYISAFQEESLPFQNADDDSVYLYMDTRSMKDAQERPQDYDIEARRRSVLEKNFLRFGRRDPLQPMRNNYDVEYDDYIEDMARPLRSGNADKSDQFVRFGRGKSDFVRFGRDSSKAERTSRDRDQHFIRFGRSVDDSKKRSKRDTYSPEYKRQGSNFLRFGRNDNFMRFGRVPEQIKEDETSPASSVKDDEERRQSESKLKQFPNTPLFRLLTELAYKLKEKSKCARLVE